MGDRNNVLNKTLNITGRNMILLNLNCHGRRVSLRLLLNLKKTQPYDFADDSIVERLPASDPFEDFFPSGSSFWNKELLYIQHNISEDIFKQI